MCYTSLYFKREMCYISLYFKKEVGNIGIRLLTLQYVNTAEEIRDIFFKQKSN
jgi:hypothetical protein